MFARTRKCCEFCVWTLVALLVTTQESSHAQTSQRNSPTGDLEQSFFFYQHSEHPRDCAEVLRRCPSKNTSNVHAIKPDGYPGVFDAHCDSDGYTVHFFAYNKLLNLSMETKPTQVIARRCEGIIGFNRSWEDYAAGFGFLSNDFWIGNQRLSYLTNQKRYELVIDVTLNDGSTISATYDEFRISDSHSNYTLINTGQFISGDGGYCYWGPWTTCSVTCDEGVRRRNCRCTDGATCTGDSVQEEMCRDAECRAVSDCQDIYDSGRTGSGMYDINPTWSQDPIQVYCNMSDGGGWTVFQRHFLGPARQDFNQNWITYKAGFGTPSGQFWIGNEILFSLTNQARYELRIDVVTTNHYPYYAKYDFFRISGEGDKYQLSGLGTFSGTADHDAIRSPSNNPSDYNIENMYFSTPDRDNDRYYYYNCASNYGGWWYNYCYGFAPNFGIDYYSSYVGQWYSVARSWENLIYTEMKIRPRRANQ